MAVSPPSLMLKIIWLVHFVLTSWGLLSGYLAASTYWFTNGGMLAIGIWAIASPESLDAIIMFWATMAISVVNDIIMIAIYEPRGHDIFEDGNVSTSQRNEYRYALGMSITSLLIKPVSLFLLYRVYQSRKDGSDFDTGIPAFGGGRGGGYDNIEQAQSKAPETQSPYYQQPPPPAGNQSGGQP